MSRLDFDRDPGLRFGYSGEGFVYLQKALEATDGRRLVKLSDWVLTLEGDGVGRRLAVAAVMLLIELQIRGRGGMD